MVARIKSAWSEYRGRNTGRPVRDDEGSVTLEQIVWTVGLFLAAGIAVGLVVAVINAKTALL